MLRGHDFYLNTQSQFLTLILPLLLMLYDSFSLCERFIQWKATINAGGPWQHWTTAPQRERHVITLTWWVFFSVFLCELKASRCVSVTEAALTWLLWMEMAQASLSGSCFRLRMIPLPVLNTQRSGFSTSVTPHRKRTRGSPEETRNESADGRTNPPPLFMQHDQHLITWFRSMAFSFPGNKHSL